MANIIDCLKAATPKDGIFEAEHPKFGRVLATAEGLDVLSSDKITTEKIVDAMHRRREDLKDLLFLEGDFDNDEVLEDLYPHLTDVLYVSLVPGPRGATYKFKFPKGDTIFNFIHGLSDIDFIHGLSDIVFPGPRLTGLDQFIEMAQPGTNMPIKPYLATRYVNVMEGAANSNPYFMKLMGGSIEEEFSKNTSLVCKAHLDTSQGQYPQMMIPYKIGALFSGVGVYTGRDRRIGGDIILNTLSQKKPIVLTKTH